ncbi:MAG: DUF5915 domain-containing protein, partial [Bacteroidota bacterium]
AAYQTLHTCLTQVAQLAAPIAPFYMDQLYQALHNTATDHTSVHLTGFPEADLAAIDTALEQRMRQAQKIVSLVHALRKQHQLKVRQPLAKLLLPITDAAAKAQITALEDLIKAEVNIKDIAYMDDTTTVVTKKVKPNFKALGKRYGAHMKAVTQAIVQMRQEDIQQLEREGSFRLPANTLPEPAQTLMLTLDDVLITSEDIPGWAVASEGATTVALDLTLTDALRQEGIARDLVNRLQNLRKEQGLAVLDRVNLALVPSHPMVAEAIQQHQAYICEEVQALQLAVVAAIDQGVTLDIDDYTVQVRLKRVG